MLRGTTSVSRKLRDTHSLTTISFCCNGQSRGGLVTSK